MKKKLIPLMEGANGSVLAFERIGDKIIIHGCKIIDRETGKLESIHSFEVKINENV